VVQERGRQPGAKAATQTDLQQAADDFRTALNALTGGVGDAAKALKLLEAKMGEIAAARRDIQLAADTIWPAGIPAHAPIRSEFKLPSDRSLK
jgi:hypothetical protein